ncbi:MAG TPA: hypothetical protein VFT12_01490, partial [Thermoanaerobaculia bacterium]|nr:hypothetical protein [Thermoanaerobaculia bacterium]
MRSLTLALLVAFPLTLSAQAPADYEQILVPFDTMTLPTGGALWRAELWVRNNGSTAINLFPDVCYQFGQPHPCTRRIDVPAQSTV